MASKGQPAKPAPKPGAKKQIRTQDILERNKEDTRVGKKPSGKQLHQHQITGTQGGRDMFGRKDKGGVAAPEKELDKAKKLSPRDVMIGQVDSLEGGKEFTFMLGEIYVKPYITVVRNATGKRFTVFQDGKDAAGNPAGKRGKFWDTDSAKDIVHWVCEREGKPYQARIQRWPNTLATLLEQAFSLSEPAGIVAPESARVVS